jgi:hypothetical protein
MLDQPDGPNGGRPPVLDETKRRTIVALLMNGSSRRMAAGYVGCAPSTLTRTAARDAEFAAQLARAEGNAETEALRFLRKAARKERYWRAAAWLLERKNPDDFAPRKPDVLTKEQLQHILGTVADWVLQDLPEDKYEQMLRRFDDLSPFSDEKPHEPNPAFLADLAPEPNDPSAGRGFATDTTTEVADFEI